MNNKVMVSADDQGNVIRQTKNPEWGQIRITQNRPTFSTNNGVDNKSVSALLLGKMDVLKNLGWVDGQVLPGSIYVKEQTEAFDPTSQPKRAGQDGPHCVTEDGEFIYRKTFYDATGQLADVLIPHANGDEIRAFYSGSTTETADSNQVHLEDAIEVAEKEAKEKAEEMEEELVDEDAFEM